MCNQNKKSCNKVIMMYKKSKNPKKNLEFKLRKNITRKILIVGKNFNSKKSLRISFYIEKIKKEGYKIEGRGRGL